MAKLKHYEVENHCYFGTATTEGRRRVFADRGNCEIVCNLLFRLRARGKLLLVGFVVMPDHMHLLVVPQGGTNLSEIMRDLKKGSARLINRRSGSIGKVWMDEYYEIAIRSEEQLLAALSYIHSNPVAAGLAAAPEDFEFSSSNPAFENDLAVGLGGAIGVETTPTTDLENTVGRVVPDPAYGGSSGSRRPRLLNTEPLPPQHARLT